MAGVYIHIPFCRQACHYCDFHFSTQKSYIDRMIAAMQEEILLRKDQFPSEISTLYFGGGTPSIIGVKHLKSLFETLTSITYLSKSAEVTLEANPDDMKPKTLQAWKDSGINRLSVGVQSFFDDDLEKMNRAHNANEALHCINEAVKIGFNDFNVDLIYGLPWSTTKKWKQNIKKAFQLPVNHLSAYCLTIEENTVFQKLIDQKKMKEPQQEQGSVEFEILQEKAHQAGFEQYEVSNFAQPGHRAVHNSSYWENKDFIGLGPGAHGYYKSCRYYNTANNIRYMKDLEHGILSENKENLSDIDLYNEFIMTRIRTLEGIPLHKINQFKSEFQKHFWKELKTTSFKDYLEEKDSYIRLVAPFGFHYADAIARDLFYVQ